MKKKIWLIMASSIKANVYEIVGKEYSLAHELDHSESRLKSGDLTTDRAGHYRAGGRGAHGEFAPTSDAHDEEHKHFAKEIADFLEKNRQENHYDAIILCAEPRFHGLINACITKSVRERVILNIEKDYIPLPIVKINAIIETIIHEQHGCGGTC